MNANCIGPVLVHRNNVWVAFELIIYYNERDSQREENNLKCEWRVPKKSKLFNDVDTIFKRFRFMTIYDLVYSKNKICYSLRYAKQVKQNYF